MDDYEDKLEQLGRVIVAELERRCLSDFGDDEFHELSLWLMKEHSDLATFALQNASTIMRKVQ